MPNPVVNQGVNQGTGILAGRVLGPILSAGRGFTPIPDFYNAQAGAQGGVGAGFQNSQFMGMLHGNPEAWKDYGLKGLGTGVGFALAGPPGAMIGGMALPWVADKFSDFGSTIAGWFGGGPTDFQRAEKFHTKTAVPQINKQIAKNDKAIWGDSSASKVAKGDRGAMEASWSGVMGKGANGETLIRGVSPEMGYRYVYNKSKNRGS